VHITNFCLPKDRKRIYISLCVAYGIRRLQFDSAVCVCRTTPRKAQVSAEDFRRDDTACQSARLPVPDNLDSIDDIAMLCDVRKECLIQSTVIPYIGHISELLDPPFPLWILIIIC